MQLLLDTHVLLWAAADAVDRDTRAAILRADRVIVSAVSVWEIEIKRSLGRLRAPDDVGALVDGSGFDRLPIEFEHARDAARLPSIHADPFDRMLVAQARAEGMVLATADAAVAAYDVPLLKVGGPGA